jgi:hypothetical protein
MGWGGRRRDFGVMWAYVLFNVGVLLLVTGCRGGLGGGRVELGRGRDELVVRCMIFFEFVKCLGSSGSTELRYQSCGFWGISNHSSPSRCK